MPTNIQFTARLQNGNVVWDDPDGNPAKDHQVHIGKGAPPEQIEIKLKDKTGLGLTFDQNAPIDIWEQQGCPPSGIATDQIEVVGCSGDRLSLVSHNTGAERTLHYQLNTVDAGGKAWRCDPIIKNEGGGPGTA